MARVTRPPLAPIPDSIGNPIHPDVHVGNLGFKVTEAKIIKEFSKYGEVEDCFIVRGPDGKSKGHGFVRFKNFETVDRVINHLHDQDCWGRRIQITVSRQVNLDFSRKDGSDLSQFRNDTMDPISIPPEEFEEPLNYVSETLPELREVENPENAVKMTPLPEGAPGSKKSEFDQRMSDIIKHQLFSLWFTVLNMVQDPLLIVYEMHKRFEPDEFEEILPILRQLMNLPPPQQFLDEQRKQKSFITPY